MKINFNHMMSVGLKAILLSYPVSMHDDHKAMELLERITLQYYVYQV